MYLVWWWGGNMTGYQKRWATVRTTGWPGNDQRASRARFGEQRCNNDCIFLQMIEYYWISEEGTNREHRRVARY